MMLTVEFYFDFGSPNAYLSHRVIPQIEARTGATFEYVPVLLGGIFKATGNQSPATAFAGIKNKLAYDGLEMRRFVERHGIAQFRSNPHFPVNTLQLMRGAVAAQVAGVFESYVESVYADMWERGRKMDDPEVLRAAWSEAGLPVEELQRLIQTDEVKSRLIANTEAAVTKGAFGSPTFIVNGTELFFGKDRLRDVEEEIVRQQHVRERA
ncbi:MAG: 2-hydroxychromene-2-carboxylate isomerase [Phenylobacterium sp.]|uniref:2-hydroxychromene-2-carboxylate isomerase n=1 Tax=Phenylobacterium sp. TaxID=1871053 RepID=UPI0027332D8E|nr:2-hydroxychromene-2-carboxylate isomerase [Phenylobacterium sp.]MDP3748619.1 2-hydroxychromene-2-carboxylate isomerase [Phenylobacterium sp.]